MTSPLDPTLAEGFLKTSEVIPDFCMVWTPGASPHFTSSYSEARDLARTLAEGHPASRYFLLRADGTYFQAQVAANEIPGKLNTNGNTLGALIIRGQLEPSSANKPLPSPLTPIEPKVL